MRNLVYLVAVCVWLFSAGAARAQDLYSYAPTGESAAIRELLLYDANITSTWWYGWVIGYGVLTAGQGTLYAISDDEGFRADNLVGAVGSALGLAGMIIHAVRPYEVPGDGDFHALLADRAAREEEGRGWLNHALSGAVAFGSGAVLWLHYDRPGSAIFNTAAGLVIGEAQIWTQPTVARDTQVRTVSFSLSPGADRVVLNVRF